MQMSYRGRLALAAAVSTLALSLLPTGPAAAADYNGLPDGVLTNKTLVIGIDGASFSALRPADMPNLQRVRDAGVTSPVNIYADPMAGTWSGPGWATIGHGVWPDKHRVKVNGDLGGDDVSDPDSDSPGIGSLFRDCPDLPSARCRDYMWTLEDYNSDISTLVASNWQSVQNSVFALWDPDAGAFERSADATIGVEDDADNVAAVADYLENGNPDSTFIQIDEVDHVGHGSGNTGPGTTVYQDALKDVDGYIGQLLDAVEARPSYEDEDWLIIVTSDHGHKEILGGHGGNTPSERGSFVIAEGGGLPAGSTRYDLKHVDIMPSILAHSGMTTLPPILDGKPFTQVIASADAFDGLRGSLTTGGGESVPYTGYTTTPPSGWSIDNSQMPSGGTAAWRGWSFATDEFWTNADLGQGREENVRARNVFAVADSDEWDDTSHGTGQFDSTLKSGYFPVSGSTAQLSFASHYLSDGPQSGTVTVKYYNSSSTQIGSPVVKASYGTASADNHNEIKTFPLTLPSGTTKVKVEFRYTGTNSAFWTVDQVKIQ
ncbi:alkaline phosphatase family protein [Streptomyces sp. NPDC020800]|uniref:alkaline phosphatase family protein n=1 Tax=Streptomyces sp. NPDC020800 TaxID=3365092 RepID=UPI00379C78A1